MAAVSAGVMWSAGPAGAVVFDFDYGEFPDIPGQDVMDSPSSSRIGVIELLDPDGLSVRFGLSALQGTTARDVTLFVPSLDSPAQDPDLVPVAIDTDPIVNLALNGVEDINPLFNVSENSLVVQDSGSSVPNDLAATTLLTFTLLSDMPVRLDRLTFIDDVDATVIVNGVAWGEIEIDGVAGGDGSCNPAPPSTGTAGDNCVAGLAFTDAFIQPNQNFSVLFNGSGGVLGFEVVELPVPAALPMMLAGLAGLGLAARRRRRAA
ncbi:hypothetical protein [Paralimibaculum aggregatum]|nr:hypothetical protein [Limibaculum sp. NKW23]